MADLSLLDQVENLLKLLSSKSSFDDSKETNNFDIDNETEIDNLSNKMSLSPSLLSEHYSKDIDRGNNEMKEVISKTIILNQGSAEDAREQILKYYNVTCDTEESLYRCIKENHEWTRGDSLRHPVLWYLAHTTCFFINKLRTASILKEPVNRVYESTFAVGVDEMSWDDKLQDRYDWPQPEEIWSYRKQVREIISNLIKNISITIPITWSSDCWVMLMGIEHARIHLETSSVLIRQLPIQIVHPYGIWSNVCKVGKFSSKKIEPSQLGTNNHHAPENILLPVRGRTVDYGRKIDKLDKLPVYGWDNEFGEMIMDVPSFSASKYLVSNEEYYEFVCDKGYETEEYWTTEGWAWVITTKTSYPKFWIPNNVEGWKLRTMVTIIDMPWDWPVITNNLEAQAFCKWKAKKTNKNIRLPTEDEWYLLRTLGELGKTDQHIWKKAPGNINLEYYASECPVDMFENEEGFYDIIGNVWQHTLTPQHPFKGFLVHPYYDDFTVPCFGPHHNMIKGGSWISTGNESISLSRYQFRRHFFQHAGIRYVESNRDLQFLEMLKDDSTYTNNDVIDMYTHFHYWDEEYFGVANFSKRVAEIALEYSNSKMRTKALDIGCAVGRTTYELAKEFDHVVGLDFTARLIGVGYRLQELGFLEWKIKQQGDIKKHYKITSKDLKLSHVAHKVFFAQNDAQNMDEKYKDFDLVVASNLIDRLSNPYLFLNKIHERINKNGTLILLSPYTWLEEFTNKSLWVGGKLSQNKEIWTEDELKKLLKSNFKFEKELDVPFVIRETARKFQHTLSHCTIWTRL